MDCLPTTTVELFELGTEELEGIVASIMFETRHGGILARYVIVASNIAAHGAFI
jgi:hypothetical protein